MSTCESAHTMWKSDVGKIKNSYTKIYTCYIKIFYIILKFLPYKFSLSQKNICLRRIWFSLQNQNKLCL